MLIAILSNEKTIEIFVEKTQIERKIINFVNIKFLKKYK